MKITHITLIILSINYLIDSRVEFSVDDAHVKIVDGSLFDTLAKMKDEVRMAGLQTINNYPEEKTELLAALDRMANAYTSETFGVDDKSNGLLFVNGLLNQILQSSDVDIKIK